MSITSLAPNSDTTASASLLTPAEVAAGRSQIDSLLNALGNIILGQRDVLELVTICLLARGHMLLEGLPGLGKTELVKALSAILGIGFRRVQFTPDLLPSDIVGTLILEEQDGRRQLVFRQGPIFTNLLLADEINRATPKTQSALLEGMQERRVTMLGETHTLPSPFFVLATQNPIELEGTYPLPEAQLDRFMFKLNVSGVAVETLEQIITERQHGNVPPVAAPLPPETLPNLFHLADRVYLPKAVANYIARLVTATRPDLATSSPEIRKFVRFGASPRAGIALAATSRAAALLAGKPNVGFDDVRRVVPSVLGHRLILDYSARLDGWTTATAVSHLLSTIKEVDLAIPQGLKV